VIKCDGLDTGTLSVVFVAETPFCGAQPEGAQARRIAGLSKDKTKIAGSVPSLGEKSRAFDILLTQTREPIVHFDFFFSKWIDYFLPKFHCERATIKRSL